MNVAYLSSWLQNKYLGTQKTMHNKCIIQNADLIYWFFKSTAADSLLVFNEWVSRNPTNAYESWNNCVVDDFFF